MSTPQAAADRVAAVLREAGFTPLAVLGPGESFRQTGLSMKQTGFVIETGEEPGAARVTVTVEFVGQDKYEHWGEAQRLANRLMDVLEVHGAGLEEIRGREPNSAFDVYLPEQEASR